VGKRKKEIQAIVKRQRHEELIRLAAGGATQGEQALAVGLSRAQVNRDWKEIRQTSPEKVAVRREQFATELDAMKRFILEEAVLTDSQMIDAWLSIVDRAAKLFGLDAPTRSENINVNVEADKLVGYRKFVVATRHLDEEQISSVYDFIASIPPRPPVELVIPDVDLDALHLKGETECES
jgi:hypothetical protein